MQSSLKQVLALVGWQLAISFAGALILFGFEFLFKFSSSGSWVGALGILIGAQTYGHRLGKNREELFPKVFSRSLALYSTFAHVVLGIILYVLTLVFAEDRLEVFQKLLGEVGVFGALTILFFIFVALLLVGLIICGMTLWGFQMGVQRSLKAKQV